MQKAIDAKAADGMKLAAGAETGHGGECGAGAGVHQVDAARGHGHGA